VKQENHHPRSAVQTAAFEVKEKCPCVDETKCYEISCCCCIRLQLPLLFNEPEVLVPIRRYHYQYSCQKNNQIAGQQREARYKMVGYVSVYLFLRAISGHHHPLQI